MPFDSEEARKLCTQAEYKLYEECLHPAILEFSTDRLLRRIKKARQLVQLWKKRKDTERVRAEQQASESGRRRATTAHITAMRKAELFQHVLDAFETRLTQLGSDKKTRITRKNPGQTRPEDDDHQRVWM